MCFNEKSNCYWWWYRRVRLLKQGFQVELFEKNNSLGGKVNLLKYHDFKFDLTASLLMIPKDYIEIFDFCNKNYKDYFSIYPLNKLYKVFYFDNTNYSFSTNISLFVILFIVLQRDDILVEKL